MPSSVISIILLGMLTLLVIVTLYMKKPVVFEGFDTSDGMPRDFDNKGLTDDQIWGDIPQNASISIFKKAEIKGATANPDAIPIADADAKGKGGGPQLTLTDIPPQTPDADDIEAILNADTTITEGFESVIEGFQSTGNAVLDDKIAQKKAEAQEKLQQKLQDAITKKLKKSKAVKSAQKALGKAAAKAKNIVMKGAKKLAQKLTGKLAGKVGAKLGAKASEGMLKKVAAKLAAKISAKVGVAFAKGAAFSSNPVTLAFGILLNVIAGIGTALAIAIPISLKGDEGVCEEGYQRMSEVWPSYLDNIPGVGDIMGALAAYLCTKNGCEPDQEEDAGLCYPKCDAGYKGVGPMCWTENVNIGVGVLKECPSGYNNDGLICREPLRGGDCTGGNCWGGDCDWHGCRPIQCAPIKCNPITGGTLIGRMNDDWRLKCPGDHPETIDGLCYAQCPLRGGNPYDVTSKYPVWIKDRKFPLRDAAQKALDAAKAAKGTSADTITNLTKALGEALQKDYAAILPPDTKYVRNPDGPRDAKYDNASPPPPSTLDSDIPVLKETKRIDPQKRLRHIPLMPYQCMGERGIAYGRGVGQPKLKTKMVKPTPPPPPPPPPHMSNSFAEDPDTKCFTDFSSIPILKQICQFYYRSAIMNATAAADGSISFGYITKVKKVIGSGEQSCDILCDITNVVVNPDTGKTLSTNVKANVDRRFYFAKLAKGCVFTVTGCTNVDGSGPDVKDAAAKDVNNYVPVLDKCADMPITLTKCQGQANVTAMIQMYIDTLPATTRVKSIDSAMNYNGDTCVVAWKEVMYDPNTNKETDPVTKVGNFLFKQDKSSDACGYTLQSYAPGNQKMTVTPLPGVVRVPPPSGKGQPPVNAPPDLAEGFTIQYNNPLPAEVTLQACTTTCKDPTVLPKLISAFNKSAKTTDRIVEVLRVVTPQPLRCDIEANVFQKDTKKIVKQRIRFDMKKDPNGCIFEVADAGVGGSGTFIQNNTPRLAAAFKTKDMILTSDMENVKSAQASMGGVVSKITSYTGAATKAYEKTYAELGQVQSLGDCAKKCSDPDILNAIVTSYNTQNYPSTRTNVTKKTMSRVLKVGTFSKTHCDVNFEEKQEVFGDLYADTPKTTVTQKTQRFKMKDTGNCQFTVDIAEGFEDGDGDGGLPGVPMGPGPPAAPPKPAPASEKVVGMSTVNPSSPNLSPPYSGGGCALDCNNADILKKVKAAYEGGKVEGFRNQKGGLLKSWGLAFLTEAFQDGEDAPAAAEDPAPVADTGVSSSWSEKPPAAAAEVPEPVAAVGKAVSSTTFKAVNKSLQMSLTKCEYEIVYDTTNTTSSGATTNTPGVVGYFQAIFAKDATGCSFTPTTVLKSTPPIIPTLPSTKTSNVGMTF